MNVSRHRARNFGLRAETIAALWLRLKFYRIIARNYSGAGGEIDIIARRGDVIAFVEVKARARIELAQVAIDQRKVRRLLQAMRHWIVRNPWAVRCVLRGDAIFLAPARKPLHVENAFSLDVFL